MEEGKVKKKRKEHEIDVLTYFSTTLTWLGVQKPLNYLLGPSYIFCI